MNKRLTLSLLLPLLTLLLLLCMLATPASSQQCNGYTMIGPNGTVDGTVISVGGAGGYAPLMNCTWIITTYVPFEIVLNFISFSTEYNKDILKVYDGPSTLSPTLATLSGFGPIVPLESAGSFLVMTWTSDAVTTAGAEGFVIEIWLRPTLCARNAIVTTSLALIADGQTNYPSALNCSWWIVAPPRFSITLTFSKVSFVPVMCSVCVCM